MNLNAPTYAPTSPYNIADPNNALAAAIKVPSFLCPSDKSERLGGDYGVANLAPSNYCANRRLGRVRVRQCFVRHTVPTE